MRSVSSPVTGLGCVYKQVCALACCACSVCLVLEFCSSTSKGSGQKACTRSGLYYGVVHSLLCPPHLWHQGLCRGGGQLILRPVEIPARSQGHMPAEGAAGIERDVLYRGRALQGKAGSTFSDGGTRPGTVNASSWCPASPPTSSWLCAPKAQGWQQWLLKTMPQAGSPTLVSASSRRVGTLLLRPELLTSLNSSTMVFMAAVVREPGL